MEIHHHPDVHHKRKKFKEYFLEFLMIFLAVTMGFFAENLREYFKDKSEIENDMQSMVADLQADVAMYDYYISENQLSDRKIDTLITLLETDRSNTSNIYFIARYVTATNNTYTPSTKTFEQMKSSAALKLIEPRKLLDSISDYYQSLQWFPGVNTLQNEKLSEVHLANSKLFEGYIFQKMFDVVSTKFGAKGNLKRPAGNPAFHSENLDVINSVIMAYHYLFSVTEVNNKGAVVRYENAKRLINLIKKEYNLQ